jgi:porin
MDPGTVGKERGTQDARRAVLFFLVILAFGFASAGAHAEQPPASGEPGPAESALTGDWGGLRASLSDSGIDSEIVYKFDVFSNVWGGAKTGTDSLDNLDLKLSLDGGKLFGSSGTTALIYVLNNNGARPGAELVDDAEGIDNIEVRTPAARLYEAWVQQNFMQDRISVLAGLYDLNSEFYITDSSGLFLRSTFGIGTDFGQTGVNGPSIFPVTSAGVRVKVRPVQSFFLQAVVLDGVPGNPGNARGTYVQFNPGDGALVAAEADYLPGGEARNGKIGIGSWRYTEKFDDLVSTDASGNPVRRTNDGMYVLAERTVYRTPGRDDDRGLAMFLRFGVANGDVNRFDYAWGTGFVFTGPFPGRERGQLGLGVEEAHNSPKYRETSGAGAYTMAYELTYNDYLAPWISVQPDVQYVIDPDSDPSLKNALVVGARFTVVF